MSTGRELCRRLWSDELEATTEVDLVILRDTSHLRPSSALHRGVHQPNGWKQ